MNAVALIGSQLFPKSFPGQLILLTIFGLALPNVGQPATFTVNNPADGPDVNPGDGVCDTAMFTPEGEPECTLTAAV